MSDYVHKKVVRLKFPNEILEKCNTDYPYDCEDYLKELLGNLFDRKEYSFQLECTDENYYIDWVYYDTYGEKSGDFGNVRYLTKNELKTITPIFDKLGVVYEDSDLRLVEYCYYNSCEAPDYYEVHAKDEAHKFLSK